MSGRLGVVGAILAKDLRSQARDRFYVLVSVMGLVFYVVVFWLLPATVEETVAIGFHADDLPAMVTGALPAGEGLEVVRYGTADELRAAVADGDEVAAGLAFPDGFLTAVAAGEATTVQLLLTEATPEELRPALAAVVRELAYAVAGEPLPVTPPELDAVVVGQDRIGEQVSLRERMRPVFVFFVLLVEMFALATLVAAEIHQRTVTAILATPARVGDVLAAKTILGTMLAFGQAVLLLLATGALFQHPSVAALLVVTLLLGALLATSLALLTGATGQDFVTIVFLSVLVMVPLAVPAFAALFPGSTAGWVRALPTYGLVQVLVGATAYGEGWREAAGHLVVLAGWCALAFAAGVAVLRRRVVAL